jgi:hypothetical protein
LFSAVEGRDCGVGGNPNHYSVFGTGGGVDRVEDTAAGYAAAVSHVALSGARIAGVCGLCVHFVQSRECLEGSTICGGYLADGRGDLYDPGLEGIGVAFWGQGGQIKSLKHSLDQKLKTTIKIKSLNHNQDQKLKP